MGSTLLSSSHHHPLSDIRPQTIRSGGSRVDVTDKDFPVLKGMALSLLTLHPNAFREPHWHPNAYELSYCLEGQGLMTIFSPGSTHDTFSFGPGSIVFVPMGSLHHIENTGKTPLKMLICFSDERPEDIDISTAMNGMDNLLLGKTFSLEPAFFDRIKHSFKEGFIGVQPAPSPVYLSDTTNRFKFDLERSKTQIGNQGGIAKFCNSNSFPVLKDLTVYSVILHKEGAREPHWHPNANELNYLAKGNAHVTLISPGGKVETFDMKAGDISYLPKGYIHELDNTGNEDCQFIIFFDNAVPSDIGISGCLGAYSNSLLETLFNLPEYSLDKLPKYQEDVMIVPPGD